MFIAFVEHPRADTRALQQIFRRTAEAGSTLITSEITFAECLYGATKQDNAAAIAAYERLFLSGDIVMVPLADGVAARAAHYGGALGLKLVDCIHYLTALEQGCDFFLTGDKRFKSDDNMRVINP